MRLQGDADLNLSRESNVIVNGGFEDVGSTGVPGWVSTGSPRIVSQLDPYLPLFPEYNHQMLLLSTGLDGYSSISQLLSWPAGAHLEFTYNVISNELAELCLDEHLDSPTILTVELESTLNPAETILLVELTPRQLCYGVDSDAEVPATGWRFASSEEPSEFLDVHWTEALRLRFKVGGQVGGDGSDYFGTVILLDNVLFVFGT